MNLADFHFIRPLFLLGLPVLAAVIWLLVTRSQSANWQRYFSREQSEALTLKQTRGQSALLAGLATAWILACLALAGPTWEQRPTPAGANQQPLVILFDQSVSMLAEDLTPNRLTRARLKLIDLLRTREDGETALIAYAGTPHIVAPLTEDARTIEALLPALSPNVMPRPGSNTEAAFEMAVELIANAGYGSGDILLISDGVAPEAQRAIQRLNPGNVRLSILGIGTREGAPIPSSAGFLRDSRDQIVVARLNSEELLGLAESLGGRYSDLRPGEEDINYLVDGFDRPSLDADNDQAPEYDQWYDLGYWLCVLLLPFALFAWRRGLVFGFGLMVFLPSLFYSPASSALDWEDLWLRADQQGLKELAEEDYFQAAEDFERQDWKGFAQYRAGDFAAATESFAQSENAENLYNLGNSLAQQGQLEEAIIAYNRALLENPEHEDAAYNRDLLQDFLDHQPPDDDSPSGGGQNQGQSAPQGQQGEGSEEPQSGQQSGGAAGSSDTDEQPETQDNQAQSQGSDQGETESSEESAGDDEAESEGSGASARNEPLEAGETEESSETGMAPGQQPLSAGSEQWLRGIPDDPAGLLRRKFQYQSELYRRQQRFAPPAPNRDAEIRY